MLHHEYWGRLNMAKIKPEEIETLIALELNMRRCMA